MFRCAYGFQVGIQRIHCLIALLFLYAHQAQVIAVILYTVKGGIQVFQYGGVCYTARGKVGKVAGYRVFYLVTFLFQKSISEFESAGEGIFCHDCLVL
jgi:hypothetical protein